MQTSFLEIVTEKVQHGAHLTDGGRGVKSYLGNAQINGALFQEGFPGQTILILKLAISRVAHLREGGRPVPLPFPSSVCACGTFVQDF